MWLGSRENCLPGLQMVTFSLCPHVMERERSASFLVCMLHILMTRIESCVQPYITYWQGTVESL